MKTHCFIIILLFSAAAAFGQTGFQAEKERLERDMIAKTKAAKAEIDKFLSDPANANDAAAYFKKAKIYSDVADYAFMLTDPQTGNSSADSTESLQLNTDAYEAMRRYQQLDPKEPLLILEAHGSFFRMYNVFFNIGAREFQTTKNFALAFEGFKNALAVEDFVTSKGYAYGGYRFPEIDDSLLLNTALAAKMAKGEAAAVPYYRRLSDANVSGEKFLSVYQFLTDYYLKRNDDANLGAILEKGRTLYPQDKYWTDVGYPYFYNLSVTLYNQLYKTDTRPANAVALQDKLTGTLKLAITFDKGIDSRVLMARHLYNYAFDLEDLIKGVNPEDVQKRSDLTDQFHKKIELCIPYAEGAAAYFAALSTLTPAQKANYKDVLDILNQFYRIKGDLKKAAEYDKKKAEIDKM